MAEARRSPSTVQELCDAVLDAAPGGFAVTSGGGSQSGAVISVERLNAIELDENAGTLTAGAGATLSSVRAAAERAGLKIPGFSTSLRSEHVGALIARGEVPRRALCGVEAVLTDGDVVKFGGKVQKDVAAYDLISLLLGSIGRLAIVTSVTFRVFPEKALLPEHEAGGETAITPVPGLRQAFDTTGALSPE